MSILVLIFQVIIAIVLPVMLIDHQYRKSSEIKRKWVWVFAVINFIALSILNVTLLYPASVNEKYWWVIDAGVFVFPCIANLMVKNSYPEFNKFDVAKNMATSEKENLLDAISSGVKKCCEEMRGQPQDLREFLSKQIKNGSITELQATLLWEKFGSDSTGN